MTSSADGKGRSLFDILTGRNKRDMTPLELQYHNPLEAKIGCTVCFEHEADMAGINFVIEKISVYETEIGREKFFHTDYHLKGTSLDTDGYIRLRLRLTPDDNAMDEMGQKIQLLYLYEEMGWDSGLYDMLNENGDFNADYDGEGETSFKVNYDDEGNELEHPRQYWRVENVPDPYRSNCTLLADLDGDGTIEDDELEHFPITSWDFSRLTDDPETQQEMTEYLTVEMDDGTRYFTFLRGTDIKAFQITVF
jgi:hypothetical protein